MSNLFFFRDQKGYDLNEKEKRVKSPYIRIDRPEVASRIDRHNLDASGLDNPGKNELLRFLQDNLTQEAYKELIDELFEEYGERGDTFNVKVFETNREISGGDLIEQLGALAGVQLAQEESEHFTYLLELNKFHSREEQGVVDISFTVQGKREDLDSDAVEIQTVEGEIKPLEEVTDEELAAVRRKENYSVEARVYIDAGIVAISNSSVDKTLQGEILNGVKRWGGN